tara:strand:- start:372 stop:1208 length:837 start_codon:yes stop_codon:yes gene_type:complete
MLMIIKLKRQIKRTFLGKWILSIKKRITNRHHLQKIIQDYNYDIKKLGTDYGGWSYVDRKELKNSTVICAGVGEDISFEIEFIKKYNANCILVDPTPRSIIHVNNILKEIGSPRTKIYNDSGKQEIESYDLENISQRQIKFIDKALWINSGPIKFFKPKNKDHVSHSIINFLNNYSANTEFIEVKGTTIKKIIEDYDLKRNFELLKLDIEGAEIPVIRNMLNENIKPIQICVEFDELNKPNKSVYAKVSEINKLLTDNGYKCIYTNGSCDFLYFLQKD